MSPLPNLQAYTRAYTSFRWSVLPWFIVALPLCNKKARVTLLYSYFISSLSAQLHLITYNMFGLWAKPGHGGIGKKVPRSRLTENTGQNFEMAIFHLGTLMDELPWICFPDLLTYYMYCCFLSCIRASVCLPKLIFMSSLFPVFEINKKPLSCSSPELSLAITTKPPIQAKTQPT